MTMRALAIVVCLFASMLSGCAERLQPVVLFYIEDGRTVEDRLRVIAREIAAEHKMRHREFERRPSREVDDIVLATRNSWLCHQGLLPGNDASFAIVYLQERISISLVDPPDHSVVHALVRAWTEAMDEHRIPYERVVRQSLVSPPSN